MLDAQKLAITCAGRSPSYSLLCAKSLSLRAALAGWVTEEESSGIAKNERLHLLSCEKEVVKGRSYWM